MVFGAGARGFAVVRRETRGGALACMIILVAACVNESGQDGETDGDDCRLEKIGVSHQRSLSWCPIQGESMSGMPR